MNDENELLEPLATEAGQQAIVRAIRDISSLEYAVRAEQAASSASAKAGEASQFAIEASEAEDKAKDWATKTDTYVEQETITIPPAQEGEEPTTETINLYSARYYAALAQDIYNNMSFDSVPTENSTNMVSSGTVYSALDLKADKSTTYTKTETDNLINTRLAELVASAPAALDTLQELATALGNDPNFATTIATQLGNKADKSDTYTKTEVDTALSNVQGQLTFDNVPTANSDNPVKSSGIKTALDGKQDTLTFDSTPTANSTNPVTSGGVYTALQNVDANIEVDDEITEDSDNPVTSAAIWEALQNFTPSGGGESVGNRDFVITGDIGSPLIPTLSSNVGSNGEAYIGGADGYYGNNAFNAFDGDMSTYTYYTGEGKIGGYVGYRFNNPVIIGYIGYIIHGFNQSGIECNIQILDENDNWITLENFNSCGDGWNTYLSGEKFIKLPILTKIKEIRAISGVKYQGQNTMVRKLQVYSATNNGRVLSEQMYSNVLYENSSGANTGNIILSDSYKNYDFIGFNFSWEAESPASNNPIQNSSIVSVQQLEDSKVGKFSIHGFGSRSTHFIIVNDTTFNCTATENGQKISKIYGIKLAKGGYSGIVSDARMTVKSGTIDTSSGISTGRHDYNVTFDSPMPDTNYNILFQQYGFRDYYNQFEITVTNKTVNGFSIATFQLGGNQPSLQDAHIDWIAIRPNSYTREGMVEDVLFSNASGVNSGTINLSGNISDYDLIQCITDRHGSNSSQNVNVNTIAASQLQNLTGVNGNEKCFLLTGYDNDYLKLGYVNDNTLQIGSDKINLYLFKITGIKFGRYVSGVAVDDTVTQNSDAVVTSGAVYDALQNYTPSGGGSGGSITIDSVPTENSQNAVSSGGVYDAIQNINVTPFSDAFFLSAHSLTPSFAIGANGVGDYVDVSGTQIAYSHGYWAYRIYKKNSSPSISCITTINGTVSVVLISLYEKGVEAYRTRDGGAYGDESSSVGTILDATNNISWYYGSLWLGQAISNVEGNYTIIDNTYATAELAAQALLSAAKPTTVDNPIRKELFSPDNVSITSGNTIPSTTDGTVLKTLISYARPIKINGETYYYIKQDNGTYYYENPNNTIAIDSLWGITITSSSSGGGTASFTSRIPNDMLVSTENQVIYSQSGRTYYKKYDGVAASGIIKTNNNVHAILVSETQNGCVGYSSYNSNGLSTPTSISVGGETFYYSSIPYGWDSSWPSSSSSNVRLISDSLYNSDASAARYILELMYPEYQDKTLQDYNIINAYTKTEVDTLLQNAGGGSSVTVDSSITQSSTNPVESAAIYTALGDKADQSTTYTKTEVDTALASKGDVTTDTTQNITGTKTFVGSKKVGFKQSTANDKLGFTLYGNTGTERGYLEFNPTNTVDGVTGLMTLGNYATSAAALTQVGFRRYSNISGASGAYNLLMPMIADARTPFSLTTTYQNFYLPLGFTDGTTTVKTAKSGVVDLSPLLASLEARIAALEGN